MASNTKYTFGEKDKEYSKKDGGLIDVIKTPKYLETKQKVIEILENGTYKGLNESYFWILMNRTASGKMAYTGLIISHDGMKIINDSLPEEKKVKATCFTDPLKSELTEGLYMVYSDNDTYEIGEISKANCLNPYPYAMLFKRTYDRVVKDKAKLYGIYSESEADEFKEPIEETKKDATKEKTSKAAPKQKATKEQMEEIQMLLPTDRIAKLLEGLKINSLEELDYTMASKVILKERKAQDENNE